MWSMHKRLCEATVSPTEASARLISSTATARSSMPSPAKGCTISCGNRASSFHSAERGMIARAQKSRTVFCKIFCSWLSSKSIVRFQLVLHRLLASRCHLQLDHDDLVRFLGLVCLVWLVLFVLRGDFHLVARSMQ